MSNKTSFKLGNPGGPGRPALPTKEHLKELCRSATPAVIERQIRIALRSKSEAAALRAAALVLERGWGKCPTEPEPPPYRNPDPYDSIELQQKWRRLLISKSTMLSFREYVERAIEQGEV